MAWLEPLGIENGGQVDMIAASATDGVLSKMDLVVLEDNRHAFPPYEVSLVARER